MAEPFSLKDAQAVDNTVPLINPFQALRSIQVDQLDSLQAGAVPAQILSIGTEPTATDTVVIGADTYEFVASSGAVADDANIAVELTGTVADTVTNLIAAINAEDADNQHANITNVATDAPALANGTEAVAASLLSAGKVLVKGAERAGGSPKAGAGVLALSETLTAAADGWDPGSVNMSTLGGEAPGALRVGISTYTVANASAGGLRVFSFDFTPKAFMVQARSSTGGERQTDGGDVFALSGNDVVLTLAGGAAPDIQDTDVVTVVAIG